MGWSIGGRHISFGPQKTRFGGAFSRVQKRRNNVGWMFNRQIEYGCAVNFSIGRFHGKLTRLLLRRSAGVGLHVVARERPSPSLRVACLQGAELDARTRAS
jgi:hypothetical protein